MSEKTATVALLGDSALGVVRNVPAKVSTFSSHFSGIIINQNAADGINEPPSLALSDTYYVQDFILPADYARAAGDNRTSTVPPLTGFQVLVGVDDGRTNVATLEYYLHHYEDGIGWTGLAEGITIGSVTDGNEVWFTVTFEPIDIPVAWLTDRFRIGVKGRAISNGVQDQEVSFDGTNIYVDTTAVPIIPNISPTPLEEGKTYPFTLNDVPSIIYVEPGSGRYLYSVQQGVNKVYYSTPNPLAIQSVWASEADGVTPLAPGGNQISLMFRILAGTADDGTDFLGNTYRSVVKRQLASNIITTTESDFDNYWLSKPNPSRFAVESLYFDVSSGGEPVTIDRVLVDPITPGVYFHMYVSNDPLPGRDMSTWEQLKWTPIAQSFKMDHREHHALREPVAAKYVKLEFSQLQARYYAPGGFQKPMTYKKYPKWVLDYFLARYQEQINTLDQFVAPGIDVVYDTLDLAYSYYNGDITQRPDDPVLLTDPQTYVLGGGEFEGQIDLTTLAQIRLAFENFVSPNLVQISDSVLGTVPGSHTSEVIQRPSADTSIVSALDRDPLILEKNFPVMYFFLPCRHGYRESLALFDNDRAYFAGVKEVTFTRDHYSARSDDPIYIESIGDTVNIERVDFEVFDQSWVTYGLS